MAKINEIVEQVVTREKEQLQEQIDQARTNVETEISEARRSLEAELVQRKAQVDVQMEKQYQIEKNSLEIEARDRSLAEKQRLINQVFQNAREALEKISSEQFHAFLHDVLMKFTEGNTEKLTLKIGDRSAHLVNQAQLKQAELGNLSVELSEETLPNTSGFLLTTGSAQFNFLFDSLIDDAQTELIADIAKHFRDK